MKDLLAREAKKAAFSIFNFQKRSRHFICRMLSNCLIQPVACYGAEIWGYKYNKKIEKVQMAFYKQYVVYG